jgi:predicted transcriptional regulator
MVDKKPDRWNDAVSYYRRLKKLILKEGTFYENGRIYSQKAVDKDDTK